MAPPRVYDDDLKRRNNFFKRMFPNFKKKSKELSVLCGNSVGFICYGPDKNDLHVWPEPQDNPQALPQIIAKFSAMSDHKRKSNACDLDDFPTLKGLSGDELRTHLDKVNTHLVAVKQKKLSILLRKTPLRVSSTDDDQKLKLGIDNATISSNCNAGSLSEDQCGAQLGFGGVYDELSYVLRGSHETLSNWESCSAFKDSRDVGVSDSSQLDPFKLGFSGSDYYYPADPMVVTDDLLFNNANDDWTVSGYDSFMGATDSFTASIYQTPETDKFGCVF